MAARQDARVLCYGLGYTRASCFTKVPEKFRVASAGPAAAPRLAFPWNKRRQNFAENVHALWREPQAPREFQGGPYFRDCWVSGYAPGGAFIAAAGWHALFVVLLIPLWNIVVARPVAVRQYTQITWYGPVKDLPLILPAMPRVKTRRAAERARISVSQPSSSSPPRGAEAFHPRQTIVNAPLHPNHPRQTLIQPQSAPTPPTILPELPNIVAWNTPSAPALKIDPAELARLKPKLARAPLQQVVAAPEVANPRDLEAIAIAAPEPLIKRPTPPVGRLAPRAKTGRSDAMADEAGAPELQATDPGRSGLIALSATPAPVAPPAIPAGNLSSAVAISPEGTAPGIPGSNSGTAKSAAGSGPPGLSITGGSIAAHTMPSVTSAPADKSAAARVRPAGTAVESAEKSLSERIQSGVAPEALLGLKRVYTLRVNMPNLTSASGSWILSFAEMAPPEAQSNAYSNPAELAAPEPLRKVDPKYPPELRHDRVQGEVVLYAVIRADGTVDSIQLVSGIDPQLDANAMQALAQWKFRPAERRGQAIDLEAIVHIPFRGAPPF